MSGGASCVRPAWAWTNGVQVPCKCSCVRFYNLAWITNRRQGRYREVGPEGSRSVNLRADGQKRHGAKSLGKAAQHVNAQGTRDTVNGAAAQGKFTFLSGETCFPCDMMLFPVKLPAGATGTKKCSGTNDGRLCLVCEIRNKDEQTGNEFCSVIWSNLYDKKTGVSRSHSSQMPGVMSRTRWRAERQGEDRYSWALDIRRIRMEEYCSGADWKNRLKST